jgi:hypothetical protein
MKTTLTVALATVVPGGFIILAVMFVWHMLARRRQRARPVLLLAAPISREIGRSGERERASARVLGLAA